jgi:hypothetical protein
MSKGATVTLLNCTAKPDTVATRRESIHELGAVVTPVWNGMISLPDLQRHYDSLQRGVTGVP